MNDPDGGVGSGVGVGVGPSQVTVWVVPSENTNVKLIS